MKTKIDKSNSRNKSSSPFFNSKSDSGFLGVQLKLNVGQPNDKYEVEADRIADEVVNRSHPERQPFFAPVQSQIVQKKPITFLQEKPLAENITPLIQRQEEEEEEMMQPKLQDISVQRQEEEEEEELMQMQPVEEEEEMLQTQPMEEEEEMLQAQEEEEEELMPKLETTAAHPKQTTEQNLKNTNGNGSSLDPETRLQMENSFGVDFGGVKIHTDNTAVQLNKELGAQAFTTGHDIYFNEGKYKPNLKEGKHLLAHELTHTIQQKGKTALHPQQNNIQQKRWMTTQNAGNIIQLTPDEDFLHTSDLQLMQCIASFDNLYHLSSTYSIGARQIGDATRTKYLAEATKFGTAYTSYSNTIAAARAEAQNQNMWIGIVVGVAAGIGLGLLAAYAIPASAGSAVFSITLGEAGAAVTSSGVQAGVGALITSGVTSSISVAGSDLQPTGLSPEVVRTSVWQKAAEIYREGLMQVEVQQRLHRLSLEASEVRRQVQQRLNGNNTTLGMNELYTKVPELYGKRTNSFPYDNIYQQRINLQNNIVSQINQNAGLSAPEMEKGIWILWINELEIADSDLLDLDAIEDHLLSIGIIGPNSILGVDFGSWTSRQDEFNAIIASISHASRIRRLFENLQTGSVDVVSSPNPFSGST